MLSCAVDHILQDFNTLFLTRFRTYKICYTTPNKNLGGEGVTDRRYTPATKSLYRSTVLEITIFGIAFYESNLSTVVGEPP